MTQKDLTNIVQEESKTPNRKMSNLTKGVIASAILYGTMAMFGCNTVQAQEKKSYLGEGIDSKIYELNIDENIPPQDNPISNGPPEPTNDYFSYSNKEIKNMSWDELKPLLDSPEKVLDYTKNSIRYKDSKEIKWPKDTVDSRIGDCEDYAILIYFALEPHGYNPMLLTIESKEINMAHTVCMYQDPKTNEYHYIQPYSDSAGPAMISRPHDNVETMIKEIANDMGGEASGYFIESPTEFKANMGQ